MLQMHYSKGSANSCMEIQNVTFAKIRESLSAPGLRENSLAIMVEV